MLAGNTVNVAQVYAFACVYCGHMYVISVGEVLLTLKAVTKHPFTSVGMGYSSRDHLEESGQSVCLLEEIMLSETN